MEGNRQALAVVIGNLLRNAFAYTDEGRIEVQIGHDAVTISDSGVGMDAQGIKEVFRPYYRGQPQRRGGHGVGLTIVRRFADRFSWSVKIDSRPGEGTRVRVGFPHARCEAHDETAPG